MASIKNIERELNDVEQKLGHVEKLNMKSSRDIQSLQRRMNNVGKRNPQKSLVPDLGSMMAAEFNSSYANKLIDPETGDTARVPYLNYGYSTPMYDLKSLILPYGKKGDANGWDSTSSSGEAVFFDIGDPDTSFWHTVGASYITSGVDTFVRTTTHGVSLNTQAGAQTWAQASAPLLMMSDGSAVTQSRALLPRKITAVPNAFELEYSGATPGPVIWMYAKIKGDFTSGITDGTNHWISTMLFRYRYQYKVTRAGAWIVSTASGWLDVPYTVAFPSATAIFAITFEAQPLSKLPQHYTFVAQIGNNGAVALLKFPNTAMHVIGEPWYDISELVEFRNVAGSMLGTSYAAPTKAGGAAGSVSLPSFEMLRLGQEPNPINAVQSYVIREDCSDNVVADGTYTYYVPRSLRDFNFRPPSIEYSFQFNPIIFGSITMDDETQDFRLRYYRNIEIRTSSKSYPQFAPLYDPSFQSMLTVMATAPKSSSNDAHEDMINAVRKVVCPEYAPKGGPQPKTNTSKPGFWHKLGSVGLNIAEHALPLLL
jgi:hypothetical protein